VAGRNPPWSRDELIVALDRYMRLDFAANAGRLTKSAPAIVNTSADLNDLPIHSERPDAQRFRNPNGVYMKLCNFLRFDPAYSGVGLERGGKLEAQIWEEFAHDPERLRAVADAILATRRAGQLGLSLPDVDEDEWVFEGAILIRQHKFRERDAGIVRRKKVLALRETGVLPCQVCDFVFAEAYGPDLGDGFIECHHIVPLAELRPGQTTRLVDLALVCSNCHRMLHRGGTATDIQRLRVRVQSLQK
jgi:5-methylcytosine-specific restriction enzyme A